MAALRASLHPIPYPLHPAFVEHRIQVGVVVHLELAVEAESALAGEDLGPEFVETLGEVGALRGQDGEAGLVALVMLVAGGGAMDFLGGVVDLQREDGEAVDDETGSFRVEGGFGVLRAGELQEKLIDLFDEVIPLLVQAVDGVLDLRDARIGRVGRAGGIFFMPEIEVGQVLRADERDEIAGRGLGGVIAMPEDVGFVVQAKDGGGVELGGLGWSGFWLERLH